MQTCACMEVNIWVASLCSHSCAHVWTWDTQSWSPEAGTLSPVVLLISEPTTKLEQSGQCVGGIRTDMWVCKTHLRSEEKPARFWAVFYDGARAVTPTTGAGTSVQTQGPTRSGGEFIDKTPRRKVRTETPRLSGVWDAATREGG